MTTTRGTSESAQMPCPYCRAVTGTVARSATRWDCPTCSRAWVFRRCPACGYASHVGALLPSRQPWTCVWCADVASGFRSRNDPAACTAGQVVDAAGRNGLDFRWPTPARPAQTSHPRPVRRRLIVTTNEIPGTRVAAVFGEVVGVTARSTSVFGTFLTGLRTIGGGDLPELARLLAASRALASERMWAEAERLGANAVVAARYDCNELQDVIVEVAAYGTAVTVEPDGSGMAVVGLTAGAGEPDRGPVDGPGEGDAEDGERDPYGTPVVISDPGTPAP